MNAPTKVVRFADAKATARGKLDLFAVFHCNLAFSSIEESERATVIKNCYWPMLELARHGPIGIEATGFTLEEIAKRDPEWIARLKSLIARGKAELIGSGYAQIIGPLVPARVTEANLRFGNEIYRQLLGVTPAVALVNEQAYSGGLVGLYLDAGYKALLMDWDNPASHHPEWEAELRYHAQFAAGSDGRSIGLLWTNTVAFQKLQRLAHNDIELDDYREFMLSQRGQQNRTLCIYASDAEVFDFRPGRYRSEEKLSTVSEWSRIAEAFAALTATPKLRLVAPSNLLPDGSGDRADQSLMLQTPAYPVPVKKQRKYNLTRWAVTGRDDMGINAACQRIYEKLVSHSGNDTQWKELCRLWASDFRTHITEQRWKAYLLDLTKMESRLDVSDAPAAPTILGDAVSGRYIPIETPCLQAKLDRRRGLAVAALGFAPDFVPVVGGLPHGYFDDISLQADWYTGDCVLEAPGEPKIVDLEWAETRIARSPDGILVGGKIATPLGPIEKHMFFHANLPRVDFDLSFHWNWWSKGSLRLGHVTLLPDAFDTEKLTLVTHNGGIEPDTFSLAGHTIDHGAPVSFLVSASCGLGMTEGYADIGDGKRGIRIEIDRSTSPLLGLLTHRKLGERLFCQLQLSALELDDTRNPTPYRKGPKRFRFSLLGKL